MYKYLLTLFCCLFTLLSLAQSRKQVIYLANKAYEEKQFVAVIDLLENYVETYPEEIESAYLLGAANYEINNFEQAVSLLKPIYNKDRDRNYSHTSLLIAESYHQLGNYRYAKRYYQRALTPYRRNRESLEYQKLKQAIASVDFSSKQRDKSFKLENMGTSLNTPNADYGFNLISENSGVFAAISGEDNEKKSHIYLAEKIEDAWQKTKPLTFNLDDSTAQVANPYYDNENNLLYFSICDSNRRCDIAYAIFDSTKKMTPITITSIRYPGASNTQPCVASIDEKPYLLFASSRPGGSGGFDIWASEISGENYLLPTNLPSNINTPGNEITPFYDNDSLYFSSDWRLSFGGFDVFKAKISLLSGGSSAENYVAINSSLNDLYFSQYENHLFLTSNREGAIIKNNSYCCNDVFTYKINHFEKPQKSDSLQDYFPLILYFDNDEPKPGKSVDISAKNYYQLLREYKKQQQKYMSENKSSIAKQDDIEDFFYWQLPKEEQLNKLFEYISRQLSAGDSITLTVRGFSSALADESYNKILSSRRINSFTQSLKSFKNEIFLPYIENNQLIINEAALGEVEDSISLNDEDGIYDITSILNRKIEIQAKRHHKKNHSNR